MTKHANAMWPKTLALANAALLAVHQIDSAFWHEWDMFGLPGGNQLNLILNIPLVGLVIHAYGRVASDAGAARRWQILIAALGFLTVGIHTAFFASGRTEFAQPVSFAIFVALAVVSCAQLFALPKAKSGQLPVA